MRSRRGEIMKPLHAASTFAALLFVACAPTEPRTQVVVTVEPGQEVRANASTLSIRVRSIGQFDEREEVFSDEIEAPLPNRLKLAIAPREGDATRRFEVEAIARSASADLVIARVISGFAAQRTLWLRVRLDDACIEVDECDETQTCEQGVCVPSARDPNSLPPWEEEAAPDGGANDGGTCGSSTCSDSSAPPACVAAGGTDSDGDGRCAEENDCNDDDPNVHAGAAESCASGGDDDCDGMTDEGCPFYVGRSHLVSAALVPVEPVNLQSYSRHESPQLSAEGTRLYYMVQGVEASSRPRNTLYVIERADPSSPFGMPRPLSSPRGFASAIPTPSSVTVRNDELEAFVIVNDETSTSARYALTLFSATREDPTQNFGTWTRRAIDVQGASLSLDALDLYVERVFVDSPGPSRIHRMHRAALDREFDPPEEILLEGSESSTRDHSPHLASDGSALLFVREDGTRSRIMAAHRNFDGTFGTPMQLTDGPPGSLSEPFYQVSSGELFWSASDSSSPTTTGIFRARVCRDAPCPSSEIECPTGLRSMDRLHCYWAKDSSGTHPAAQSACQAEGGHLATVTSAAELSLIEDALMRTTDWIGLVQEASQWRWVTGEPLLFEAWISGEPDGTPAPATCGRLWVSAGQLGWADESCSSPASPGRPLCERELWPTW